MAAISARRWPAQVRWAIGVMRGLLADPGDDLVGALPGAAAGAVGDGDETGGERLELGDRAPEGELGGVGLGREELERERRPGGEEISNPGHDQHASPARRRERTGRGRRAEATVGGRAARPRTGAGGGDVRWPPATPRARFQRRPDPSLATGAGSGDPEPSTRRRVTKTFTGRTKDVTSTGRTSPSGPADGSGRGARSTKAERQAQW